jgi:uncharacterized protein YeaO (DUF488 family)
MSMVRLKRVYEDASPDDGTRVLVDRLWPRGLKRDAAMIDLWLKDVAPSDKLRRWFNHDPARWAEFRKRYRVELAESVQETKTLRGLTAGNKPVTLLFAAKDREHNNAVVLSDWLSGRRHGSGDVKKKITPRG